ncbi:protein eva-1 homolog C isoform X2 [Erpetoichthys calabaricus]|uniref:protein eva-1 homolog C isoform X2 n=1 Tax=Erpetoichthys calabaricus TaxID=27687 RepID=UPI002234E8FA|nr:protein eva-1 homolog C isoform X2 [Erpetoichthys calabaricus]
MAILRTVVWWPISFLFFSSRILTAPQFSVYLQKILKNQTAHACDGELLSVTCPHKTSISVLSAFYGRKIPSDYLCPTNGDVSTESRNCSSLIAIQKVHDECQDQRSCHLLVNSRVFGSDPCPSTSKYLIVSFKCKPENHRSKTVCENGKLRLVCRNQTVLAIYSATFGHLHQPNPECPQDNAGPDIDCLSYTTLKKVSRRCHGKPNCSLTADTQTFGDPCYPGLRKHLRVSYTCVPRSLLDEAGREAPDPFSISDYNHGLPEAVALYFVSGICAGLVFLFCIFGLKATMVQDVKNLCADLNGKVKTVNEEEPKQEETDDSDDDTSSESSFRRLARSYHTSENVFTPEMTAEIIERAEEKIENEIWVHRNSSPYAIHKIRIATQ